MLGLDVASSEFYKDGVYNLESEGRTIRRSGLHRLLWRELAGAYPIITIEDGMDEGDWDGWKLLTEADWRSKYNSLAMTCSSQIRRFCSAESSENIANAILIKPNQIGTLSGNS